MKVKYIRSDGVYQKIANASIEKKNDIYRYELMMPFKKKWDCYSVPMKASTPNGYDVIMASSMLGLIAPSKVDKSQQKNIEQISSDLLWTACQQSIQKSLDCFANSGIEVPVQEYLFTILFNILWSGCQLLLHMKSIIIFDFNLFDGEMILHWPK